MKIGIDATSLPPNPVGAGTYIIQLIREITALPSGHQFVIFAQKRGRELIGNLPAERVRWLLSANISPALRLVWEQTRLPQLAASFNIDLLHSPHYTRPRYLPCASVVTLHDMTFFLFPELHTRMKRIFFPWAIRMSARLSEALIAVSESTRCDAIRLLDLHPDKITTVPLGISSTFQPVRDAERLRAVREKYHLPESFILYTGTIEPRKNLPLLLNAYACLAETITPPPLVLVGKVGWMVENVFQQIKELNLSQKVLLPGYIPSEDLPALYSLSQIFVYPSTYEGFGLPPLEAMACGAPVITTAVSSMLENIREAGLLVPPNDKAALADAMHSLLADPSRQDQLSRAGILHAARFTWRRTAEETLQVYEKAARI